MHCLIHRSTLNISFHQSPKPHRGGSSTDEDPPDGRVQRAFTLGSVVTDPYQLSFVPSAAGLTSIPLATANRLLATWGHYLGACQRPFGAEAWALEVAGEPLSVAVSASTTSSTAAGYERRQLVELARLCTAPTARWATRPMLRLWREVAAPAWSYWRPTAAVAYSQNNRHDGSIYRFDGWTRHTCGSASGGGGTWSRRRDDGHAARGRKTLWLWRFDHDPAAACRRPAGRSTSQQ